MVVSSYNCCHVITWCAAYFRWQFCCCTFYLFTFLMRWKQNHTTLVVIAIGFTILFLIFKIYWLLAPVAISVLGFAISPLGQVIHRAWFSFAKMLGYINNRILLFLIFFVILTPIAFLRKLFGKNNPPDKHMHNSYFQNRNQVFQPMDLQNPW